MTDIVTSVIQHVNPPSSATGHARGGKHSSRSSSLEAGPRRTFSHVPRSESTGGASGLVEEDPPRRRGQMGDGGDAGEGLVSYQDLETASIAESGTFFHHTPDEGATFTLVPSEESTNRGSATATPYSASRASADASPRGLPNSGAAFYIRAANQVNLKQSAPGPSNVAGAGITGSQT